MKKLLIALILFSALPVAAQRNDLGTARMIEALEAMIKEDGTCCLLPSGSGVAGTLAFTGTPLITYPDAGSLTIQDVTGDAQVIFTDVPDLTGSDAEVAIVEIDYTPGVLDAGDTIHSLLIDIGNAAHTGGIITGISIASITATSAAEVALQIGGGFTRSIQFTTATPYIEYANGGDLWIFDTGAASVFHLRDVPAAGTANDLMELDSTLSAMDGGADLFRGMYLNLTNANHSNGSVYAISAALDAVDPDSYESAYYANDTWDTHLTMMATAASTADCPPTGAIGYFTDDNSDWSGGGGNDCALVAVDSSCATDVIAVLVVDGVCP